MKGPKTLRICQLICQLICLLACLLWLAPPLHATEELPAIGIDGKFPLTAGKPVKIMVSHASYPRLEDFTVTAIYAPSGPWPRRVVIGHPNDYGLLAWTPRYGGTVQLTAVAPGPPPVEISHRFQIEGKPPWQAWPHLLVLGLGILLLSGGLIRRQARKSDAARTQKDFE